ncbi:protein RESPONSE TO ABA AND SALT 1-like [Diospyros lotus]|uniref:protein RESPONSE TO ABA AND SALT 1-like n=1 Tax=Diospyros lotus TaxID=55363 RepID=UPI0022504B34|nr:protein RESPONSE TO ABA AND SALT 1-like [Diospyros lotus]
MPSSSGASTSNNNGGVGVSFESFLEGWLVRQEHYLDELLTAQQNHHESHERDLKDLISRVLSHYQQYYEEKSRAAHCNVFIVFSPTWFTPFERTFLWIGGFKPGMAFSLVETAVDDLTQDQRRRVARLRQETRAEEKALTDQLARIQESVAAPPVVELVRREGQGQGRREGEEGDTDAVVEALRAAMEGVLGSADTLRTRTAERVVEILNPVQNVKFLAAAAQLQLKIRMWGLQRERGPAPAASGFTT